MWDPNGLTSGPTACYLDDDGDGRSEISREELRYERDKWKDEREYGDKKETICMNFNKTPSINKNSIYMYIYIFIVPLETGILKQIYKTIIHFSIFLR